MEKTSHCIVYRLHKDKSPTVINCFSEKEQDEQLSKIIKEGYKNAYKARPEQAAKVLDDYGKQFEEKPLTQKERWDNWVLGMS